MASRRMLAQKVKVTLLFLAFCLLFLTASLYYVPSVRNILLSPVLPHSWRSISTADIIQMHKSKPPVNVTNLLHCKKKTPPHLLPSDVPQRYKMLSYPKATQDNDFFRDEAHVPFLPGVRYQDRVDMLWMYLVMAHALKNAKVPFFFVNGSLLGVFRHGGGIPWDTDVDLALNVTDWKTVREVLSCIEGFRLETKPFMHWKLFREDTTYPFIDLFFYTEDDVYLWSLTDYELKSLVYEKKNVLPLTLASYEGVLVPVPARTDIIVRQEFDIEYCYPPSLNYKTGVRFKQSFVMCSSLAEVYPIQNMKF